MSGLELNKILASIIFAVLVVTLIGHFGDLIINTEHHDEKEKCCRHEAWRQNEKKVRC